jgi:serralysin
VWTGGTNSGAIFQSYSSSFPDGASYIAYQGLSLNGQNAVFAGFACTGAHHLKFISNTIANMGAAGITSVHCDYMISEHNTVYHSGYNQGWASGIDYGLLATYDSYAGIHNVMANNIVAGEYDGSSYHSDGNGLILDDGGESTPAKTPATLIVNNVVYGNGGRCIQSLIASNVWVINNTCYENGLDTAQSNNGEIANNSSNTSFFVNNLVESWNKRPPFWFFGSSATNLTFNANMIYGGTNSGTPSSGFTTADPGFVSPPVFNATASGQYANAINPASLGDGLDLQSSSPAINAGIDPISLAGTNSDLKSDLSAYIYTDIKGNSRPAGGPFTLGAYQP